MEGRKYLYISVPLAALFSCFLNKDPHAWDPQIT